MSPHEFTIRTMTRGELDLVVEWADAEGWNPGRFDADCYFKADPTGFLVGLLKGEPIASISVVKYGKTFAFLGFYLVVPAFRGKGYGLKIWRHGMKTVKDRNVGLD
ncbi:MAG: GNAT family N-acetyltransferase, partial [Proteobacteria bacterium]|nr:GNAT family N-acetyltransferase [Pseudomonadota bacterium]